MAVSSPCSHSELQMATALDTLFGMTVVCGLTALVLGVAVSRILRQNYPDVWDVLRSSRSFLNVIPPLHAYAIRGRFKRDIYGSHLVLFQLLRFCLLVLYSVGLVFLGFILIGALLGAKVPR